MSELPDDPVPGSVADERKRERDAASTDTAKAWLDYIRGQIAEQEERRKGHGRH